MAKIKSLLPTLRERKRYVGFEIIGNKDIQVDRSFQERIFSSFATLFGEVGLAKAGLLFVKTKKTYKQKGIIRVNHMYLDHLRAALAFIKGNHVIKSITASGMIVSVEKQL